jgi:hypothetical protein
LGLDAVMGSFAAAAAAASAFSTAFPSARLGRGCVGAARSAELVDGEPDPAAGGADAGSLSSQRDPARSSSRSAFLHGTHVPRLPRLRGRRRAHPICTTSSGAVAGEDSDFSPSGFGTHLGHARSFLDRRLTRISAARTII